MKKGELRREAIVRAAERLFFEKGYEETSIQDILDELSISKGGFYHHFDSKIGLLAEICRQRVESDVNQVGAALRNSLMDATQKLNALLAATLMLDHSDPKFSALVLKVSYLDGDVQFREQMRAFQIESLRPLVDEALAQGMADDSFFSRHPARLGELLLLLSCNLNDALNRLLARDVEDPECAVELLDVLDSYREAIELLTGAAHGRIYLMDVEHFLKSVRQTAQELRLLKEGA